VEYLGLDAAAASGHERRAEGMCASAEGGHKGSRNDERIVEVEIEQCPYTLPTGLRATVTRTYVLAVVTLHEVQTGKEIMILADGRGVGSFALSPQAQWPDTLALYVPMLRGLTLAAPEYRNTIYSGCTRVAGGDGPPETFKRTIFG
jgi:hypothetical protein